MLKTTHRLFLITFLVMGLILTLTTISFSPVEATPVDHSPLTAPLSLGAGNEEGYTHLSLLSVFGPMAPTHMGDPYSPNSPNNHNYEYQMMIPADYEETAGTSIVRVELFDPDSMNSADNNALVTHTSRYINVTGQPLQVSRNCGSSTGTSSQRTESCLIPTCEWAEQTGSAYPHCSGTNNQHPDLEDPTLINPFWLMRVDENRLPGGEVPTAYTVSVNTQTRYELSYYQNVDGERINTPLSVYFGLTGDVSRDRPGTDSTDLLWVSPGAFNAGLQIPAECGSVNGGSECAGDDEADLPAAYGSGRGFEVDLSQDTPNIETDAAGNRYLQLSITALSGSSRNSFAIWAGPPSASVGLPLDANSRNVYSKNNPNVRSSAGIKIYGVNRLTQSSLATEVVEMPVMFLAAEDAGADVWVRMFDLDTGSKPPITFYFDTIPTTTYSITYGAGEDPDGRCFDGGATYTNECNNWWVEFPVTVPTDFTGGLLMASYQTGRDDTHAIQGIVGRNPVLRLGSDVAVVEGDTGIITAVLTVSLNITSTEPITVSYATQNITATAGVDYEAMTGTVTFAPGEISQTIAITIFGDEEVEEDEIFHLVLSEAENALIGRGEAVITILNDDLPQLTLADAQMAEGDSGSTALTLTVSLSAASAQTVTVNFATQDSTATAGVDYEAMTGTVTFAPGEISQTITITIFGDEEIEEDETFHLVLSEAENALIGQGEAVITILNDDLPQLTLTDAQLVEGDSGSTAVTLTVSLSAASAQTVTVNFATQDITATAGVDYQAITGTVTFAPGETTQTIAITIFGDEEVEEDEIFHLVLSEVENASLADDTAVITIVNDDEVTPPAGYTLFLPVVVRP